MNAAECADFILEELGREEDKELRRFLEAAVDAARREVWEKLCPSCVHRRWEEGVDPICAVWTGSQLTLFSTCPRLKEE